MINPVDNRRIWQGELYASSIDTSVSILHGKDLIKYTLFIGFIKIGDYTEFILLKKDEYNIIQAFSSPSYYQYGHILITNKEIVINIHSSVGYSVSTAKICGVYALA